MDIRAVEVIAPNFKRRLSGVTSTLIQLLPRQVEAGVKIAALGPGLPDRLAKIGFLDLLQCWNPPQTGHPRVWHARRNSEMLAGVILRKVLRMPMRLLFTSAAQRQHSRYTKWLIRRMDHVVATSARSGAFLDVPHTVIMHGIDTKVFHPADHAEDDFSAAGLPGRHAIGCAGRIRQQKGTDLFVDAMIELLPRYPEWTAIITGRVTAKHQSFAQGLATRIAAAGLSARILFLGEVDDIRIWYRRFALFVAPSRNEGFGLTPLEAMASETAVVASDAGAYAEMIVPGQTGQVVPAGDGTALTAAIESYMADINMARQAGSAALRHVRSKFELAREVRALDIIYRQLMASNGSVR